LLQLVTTSDIGYSTHLKSMAEVISPHKVIAGGVLYELLDFCL